MLKQWSFSPANSVNLNRNQPLVDFFVTLEYDFADEEDSYSKIILLEQDHTSFNCNQPFLQLGRTFYWLIN